MIADHLIEEIDTKKICVYCNKSLEKHSWESVFAGEIHYKKTNCKCGKENRVKVDFMGSGHDSWDGVLKWLKDSNQNKKETKQKIKLLEPLIKEIKRVN